MPADTLTFSVTGPLAEQIRAAAEAEGLTPDEFMRQEMVESIVMRAEAADLDWEEDLRRLEEAGEDVDLETAFAEFRQKIVEARRAKP